MMDMPTQPARRDRLGDLFTALRRDERRKIVRYLAFHDRAVAVPELADAVNCPGVSLLHNHLPHLDARGVVDVGDGTVQRGMYFDAAVAILDAAEELDGEK